MHTKLLSLFIVLTIAIAATGGEDKALKKVIEDQAIYVETAQPGVVLSGYVDASYTYQFAGGLSGEIGLEDNELGSFSTEAQFRAFDVDHNDFNINAIKIAIEKALPLENMWAAGFRVDLMFGEDAGILNEVTSNVLNFGVGDPSDAASHVFLEQAYVQFRIPVGTGLDIKFGKFVTQLGYEVIESYANLNFSRGLLFQNAFPLTHTGVLAEYSVNDYLDLKFGLVNGWNSSDSNSTIFPGPSSQKLGIAATGTVALHSPGRNATLSTSWIYSPDGEFNAGAPGLFYENGGVGVFDIWGQWIPKFADDRLLLAFNAALGFANDTMVNSRLYDDANESWHGAALYAKYQFTDIFSLSTRAEWFRTQNGTKVSVPGGTDSDFQYGPFPVTYFNHSDSNVYSYTVTGNFDLWENLLMRVEYRYDFWDSEGKVFNVDSPFYIENNDQHQVALNFVYTF